MSSYTDAVAQALAKTVNTKITQARTLLRRGTVTLVGTDGTIEFSVGDLGERLGIAIGDRPVAGETIVYLDDGSAMPIVLGTLGGGAWTAYTPTWTNTGSAPALGNGSIAGRYMRRGKTLHLSLNLSVGSTSTVGSGVSHFSLPAGMTGTGATQGIGSGYWVNASDGIFSPAVSILDGGASFVYPWIGTGTSPMEASGLQSGDVIKIQGTFEIA